MTTGSGYDGSMKSLIRAKLGDFGFARELNDDEKAASRLGTPSWSAPELLAQGDLAYGPGLDIRSAMQLEAGLGLQCLVLQSSVLGVNAQRLTCMLSSMRADCKTFWH